MTSMIQSSSTKAHPKSNRSPLTTWWSATCGTPSAHVDDEGLEADIKNLHEHVAFYRDLDYGRIEDLARKSLAEIGQNTDYLDAKAEKLLNFVTASLGILVALAGILGKTLASSGVAASILPTAFGLVMTAAFALRALRVCGQYQFPGVMADFNFLLLAAREEGVDPAQAERLAHGNSAAQLYRAAEYQRRICGHKGSSLRRAQTWLLGAIVWLLLPLVVISFHV